jgi:tartrate-resistant acid phosphatase type 5
MSAARASRRALVASALLLATCGKCHGPGAFEPPLGRQASSEDWLPPAPEVPDAGCPAPDEAAATRPPHEAGAATHFAVIGDYGSAGPVEQAVAELVAREAPEFILTLGDNNYPLGDASTIDFNVGLFYHAFIAPYLGRFGCGAARNRFFPSLGNHDWYTGAARPYLDYFTLPGNERYYDVAWGDVHVFALDSDPNEPDGVTADSTQAAWLRDGLAAAKERWKLVYMHHPPYSSGPHGGTPGIRWPFRRWGADLVLSGHDHTYEHVVVDGLNYLVNGLGGATFYSLGRAVAGSAVRFNEAAGALFIEADAQTLRARFQTVDGRKIDELVLTAAPNDGAARGATGGGASGATGGGR